jgi:dynein heavy chain
MALLARHRYMISRLSEAFEYPDEAYVERMMQVPEVLQLIDYFFTADGPTKIVITQEKVVLKKEDLSKKKKDAKESNAKEQSSSAAPEMRLQVHMGDVEALPTTAVFFMKLKKGKDNDDHYALDPTKLNDGNLSFGVIRTPLDSLEVVVRCVYRPIMQEMGNELWGEASSEQRSEFLLSLDIFTRSLQDSIHSLSGGLELARPDDRIEVLGSAASSDYALVGKSINLLQEWCTSIETYLDDSNRNRWETSDSGPDTELNYWRSRMQRYNYYESKLIFKC